MGDAIRILRDVVDALAYAHAQGVVHRAIKPDNVLISRQLAVVTDFGVAKAMSAASGTSRSRRRRSIRSAPPCRRRSPRS